MHSPVIVYTVDVPQDLLKHAKVLVLPVKPFKYQHILWNTIFYIMAKIQLVMLHILPVFDVFRGEIVFPVIFL